MNDTTIAPAFRAVDQLTGKVADLEARADAAEHDRDQWCDRCAAALAQLDDLKTVNEHLAQWIATLITERNEARTVLSSLLPVDRTTIAVRSEDRPGAPSSQVAAPGHPTHH